MLYYLSGRSFFGNACFWITGAAQSKVAHLQQDDFLTVTDIDMQSTAESLSQKTGGHLSVSLVQGKHSIGSWAVINAQLQGF